MTTAITLTEHGTQITGIPPLETWAASLTLALDSGAAATWQRTDLITFALDESPYGDDLYQYLNEARISLGTTYNDTRRGRRFPYGHDLRRFDKELSVSHFDAVAPLGDTDAEVVLAEAAQEGLGREWVRQRVKELKNIREPEKATLTLTVSADGTVQVDPPPPTWAWGGNYTVTIKEQAA